MDKPSIAIGDLVEPKTSIQLFNTLWHGSPYGKAFMPNLGPIYWFPKEIAVVIDIFDMPFDNKNLYRVLLNSGGVGWAWDFSVIPVS